MHAHPRGVWIKPSIEPVLECEETIFTRAVAAARSHNGPYRDASRTGCHSAIVCPLPLTEDFRPSSGRARPGQCVVIHSESHTHSPGIKFFRKTILENDPNGFGG